jgi:hypothetical protein
MRHLFTALALPIFAHAYFYLPDMKSNSVFSQVGIASFAVVFFFSYLYFNDRSLIVSTKNLIFKGE